MLEMKVTLAQLVRQFVIKPSERNRVPLATTIRTNIMNPTDGVWIKLEKRQRQKVSKCSCINRITSNTVQPAGLSTNVNRALFSFLTKIGSAINVPEVVLTTDAFLLGRFNNDLSFGLDLLAGEPSNSTVISEWMEFNCELITGLVSGCTAGSIGFSVHKDRQVMRHVESIWVTKTGSLLVSCIIYQL